MVNTLEYTVVKSLHYGVFQQSSLKTGDKRNERTQPVTTTWKCLFLANDAEALQQVEKLGVGEETIVDFVKPVVDEFPEVDILLSVDEEKELQAEDVIATKAPTKTNCTIAEEAAEENDGGKEDVLPERVCMADPTLSREQVALLTPKKRKDNNIMHEVCQAEFGKGTSLRFEATKARVVDPPSVSYVNKSKRSKGRAVEVTEQAICASQLMDMTRKCDLAIED
ncbi:Exosome complex uclease [Phytophthora megakarya]|uniref:Exosome complex uclease n=1 Tax=Phytophthora megakarya TaxID=4795 RepID=A0A225WBW8_9STRA|nr:Exosome complex uclease [Phytophthora megakarya]